jgi:hypothetical protein
VSKRPSGGVGDDDAVGVDSRADSCRALCGAFREQQQVVVGNVRAVDAGVDTDVAEVGRREKKRCLHDQLRRLLQDGLCEARVLLFARAVSEPLGDLDRARTRRKRVEVERPTLRLRDDRAGDADDVVTTEVDRVVDQRGEVVSLPNFGKARDGEQLHTVS